MSEQRCGTCKHFGHTDHAKANGYPGYCYRIQEYYCPGAEFKDLACVSADVGGVFYCRPNFGCVLWESKETTNE